MEIAEIKTFINDWIPILSNLKDLLIPSFVGIVAYLIGITSSKLRKTWDARKTRAILKLNKNKIEVILPIREGRITKLKTKTSPHTQYVTLKEVEILLELRIILELLNKPKNSISVIADSKRTSPTKDLFYIGGAFANEGVYTILTTHFPCFKIACSIDSFNQYDNLKPLLVPNTENNSKRWLVFNDKKILPFDSAFHSYVIIARLSGKKHYGDPNRGTTHVLFGSDAVATLSSIKCFTEHQDEIFSKIKNKGECYMVAFLCSKRGEIDFNTFYDIV